MDLRGIFFSHSVVHSTMRIIVVGYGRVGARTARVLNEEGHQVVVVENNYSKVERAEQNGLTVVEGDGTDPEILKKAGLNEADSIGGITGDIKTNYEICLIGKEHGLRTVLRISEDVSKAEYETYTEVADEMIYPERLGAAGAKTALLGGSLNAIGDLTETLQLTVVTIPEGSPVVGEHVNELSLPETARLYAHGGSREPLTIPLPGTILEAGDRVALLIEREAADTVRTILLGEE